jgi:single-strand DNA-binding protein
LGTLGRDPEMKYLPSGSAVVTISVATDESYNDKQTGQKVERTEWHRLTAFGKLAEIIGQYLKKGSKAYFEGKLRTNEYEKDGIKRYSTEIVVSDMMMLDGKPQDGQQQGGFAPQSNQMQGSQQPAQQNQNYGQQQGGYQPQQQAQPMQNQGFNQQPRQQQGGFQPQNQPMNHSNNFDSFGDDIPF